MKFAICILVLLIVPAVSVQSQKAVPKKIKIIGDHKGLAYLHKTTVINQTGSPIQIVDASVYYVPPKTRMVLEVSVPRHLRRLISRGAIVNISIQGGGVIAVKFGVLLYDTFREFVGGFTPLSMKPPT